MQPTAYRALNLALLHNEKCPPRHQLLDLGRLSAAEWLFV